MWASGYRNRLGNGEAMRVQNMRHSGAGAEQLPGLPGRLRTASSGLAGICALLLLGACTTTEIDQFRQTATSISSDESIVILGRRQKSDYETESNFVDCVGSVVAS